MLRNGAHMAKNPATEREIALKGLIDIIAKKSYSNIALRRILAEQPHMNKTQKAFITEIITGCIRNLTYLDYIIDNFSNTSTAKMNGNILNILRISIYQMRFMDKVPVFAICDEAVKLTKSIGPARLSSFTNGVLRNVARRPEEPVLPDNTKNLAHFLSIKYSCSMWIVEHFLEELGEASTVQLFEASSKPSGISLSVNTNRTTVDELQELLKQEGLETSAGKLIENTLRISKTSDIGALPSFKSGLYHIMDEAAMMAVCRAVSGKEKRILDLCAAPGGKSFLAAYLSPKSKILSCDIHGFKLKQLKESTERLGLDYIKIRKNDAAVYNEEFGNNWDLVIVDAPCSGLGTLGRRPDIKHNKMKESIKELAELQRHILTASWKYVAPGGKLLYSTCTISKAENIDNRNWFLENFPFKPVDFGSEASKPEFSTAAEGYVQILPQYYNTDGFFIAIFERV